ncbi:MAG TPA: T9SS type A sorting domain-containing protein, partial [Flavisolibacter sp.]|nr:T9SS type A sorting domain-containing protein [Flavisolibacter sp.]
DQVRGQILFSTKQIMTDVKGIRTLLQASAFKYKSFAPAMPWKDAVCPNAPLNIRREADTLRWDTPAPGADGDLPKRYAVYKFASMAEATTNRNDGRKVHAIVYGNKIGLSPADVISSYFMVTALDKANNESEEITGILLPVTGLQFTVKLSGNTAVLNWRTLTEINTRNFEVERSSDGRNFSYTGRVAAAGNSNGARQYGLQDFLPGEGTYHYRIKSIDRDGRSSYSEVRSVTYRPVGDDLVLGPNPFSNGINITNLRGVQRVEIVDLSGRILLRKLLTNQSAVTLEMSGLPAGIYHLRAIKTSGGFAVRKLVKL